MESDVIVMKKSLLVFSIFFAASGFAFADAIKWQTTGAKDPVGIYQALGLSTFHIRVNSDSEAGVIVEKNGSVYVRIGRNAAYISQDGNFSLKIYSDKEGVAASGIYEIYPIK